VGWQVPRCATSTGQARRMSWEVGEGVRSISAFQGDTDLVFSVPAICIDDARKLSGKFFLVQIKAEVAAMAIQFLAKFRRTAEIYLDGVLGMLSR
jgi:hypothetical protein